MNNKSFVIFISCLIFWLFFAPKAAIIPDPTLSGRISNAISLLLLLFVIPDLKNIFNERNRTFNILLLAYLTVSAISVYYNSDTIKKYELTDEDQLIGITSIKYLLYNSIGVFASSVYVQRIANTRHIKTLLRTFIILFLVVLVPTYIDIITTPIDKEALTEYSVGNKFNVGYYHLYLSAFYYFLNPRLKSKKHKLTLLLFLLLMICSSIITQCSTMVVAALLFLFLSLFASEIIRDFLSSPKVIVISVILLDIGFFLFATWIMQSDLFQYIVTDLLNRDATLTGRLQVYADIRKTFTVSPWIGLGYGNSVVISRYFTNAYDTQNGLIELFIQIGIIGVVVFLLLLYIASKNFEKNGILRYPFVAIIYTIIGISIVEIPFKLSFIFFLSFCFVKKKSYPKDLLELIREYYKRKILAKIISIRRDREKEKPLTIQ